VLFGLKIVAVNSAAWTMRIPAHGRDRRTLVPVLLLSTSLFLSGGHHRLRTAFSATVFGPRPNGRHQRGHLPITGDAAILVDMPKQHRTQIALGSRADDANDPKPEVKLSSMFQSTVNLVKNIVGAGMLSLPAGVAAFSGNVEALVPAVILTAILGFMSAYGFILIADACKRTGSSTYADAWAGTMSPGTAWLPSLACMSKAVVGCISFSMILGDCWSLILQPLGLPAIIASRGAVMVWVTLLVLIPLCNMRSLAPLAKFSVTSAQQCVHLLLHHSQVFGWLLPTRRCLLQGCDPSGFSLHPTCWGPVNAGKPGGDGAPRYPINCVPMPLQRTNVF